MNNITTYNFNQNQVRTQLVNGEPYFCLTDACKSLNIADVKNASKRLDEKGKRFSPTLTNGGRQELTFINEPNLYRLIFRSNKPQAQAFADWVYSEVLPSIRKTGGYGKLAPITQDKEAMKAIGGLVKKCCAAAVRDEVKAVVKEAIEETVVPYMLNGGINYKEYEGMPTADGLPFVNWIIGITHGANALNVLIERMRSQEKEVIKLLERKGESK